MPSTGLHRPGRNSYNWTRVKYPLMEERLMELTREDVKTAREWEVVKALFGQDCSLCAQQTHVWCAPEQPDAEGEFTCSNCLHLAEALDEPVEHHCLLRCPACLIPTKPKWSYRPGDKQHKCHHCGVTFDYGHTRERADLSGLSVNHREVVGATFESFSSPPRNLGIVPVHMLVPEWPPAPMPPFIGFDEHYRAQYGNPSVLLTIMQEDYAAKVERVHDAIAREPLHADDIAERTNLTYGTVVGCLAVLQDQDRMRRLPGALYDGCARELSPQGVN